MRVKVTEWRETTSRDWTRWMKVRRDVYEGRR